MSKIVFIVLLLLASFSTYAERESTIRIGYSPRIINLSVDDPDGNTNSSSEAQYLGAMVLYEMSRNKRLYSYLALYDFALDPGVDKTGQDVESTSFGFYYQSNFKLSRSFKPWLGVGGVVNVASFTNRLTVDSDGYIENTYSDRDDTAISLGLSASNEWKLNDSLSWGINVEYLYPLGETLEGFTASLNIIYD